MAHFFKPVGGEGISEFVLSLKEKKMIGLYGGGWDGSELHLRIDDDSKGIVSWEEDKKLKQPGPKRFFYLTALKTGQAKLRATLSKDGQDDFVAPVILHVVENAATNPAFLLSKNPLFVYPNNDYVFPLEKSYGGALVLVRGMAVHTTAGLSNIVIHQKDWDARGVSAHFVINQEGKVAQFVALCYQAWAQGPGNPYWISVEMTSNPDQFGKGAPMTEAQLNAGAKLFRWLSRRYGFSPTLATPYTGAQMGLGNVYKEYQAAAEQAAKDCGITGSTDADKCIASNGLSCHQWLQPNVKVCPGLDIIKQLPEVVRRGG